jgi:hypothetical protein
MDDDDPVIACQEGAVRSTDADGSPRDFHQ